MPGFDAVSLGITLGTSLFGGAANLIADQQAAQQDAARRRMAIQTLSQNLVGTGQLEKMLQNTSRLFNNRLVSTLNTSAIRSRGTANAGVLGAAITGQMRGAELQTQSGIQNSVLQNNQQIGSQIAQLQAGGANYSGVGSFASGLLTALPTGWELAKLNNPQLGLKDNTSTNTTNPFIDKKKITNDMIDNFSPLSKMQQITSSLEGF